MSSFSDYRGSTHNTVYEPSLVRPVDATDGNIHSAEQSPAHPHAYLSRNSMRQAWNPNYNIRPAPPVEAIAGIPTPAMGARGLAEMDDFDEFMEVEPPDDFAAEMYQEPEEPGPAHPHRRRFVGGFVAGLKRLPRAMARNLTYERRAVRPLPAYPAENDPADFRPTYHEEAMSSPENAPPYDALGQHVEGDLHYVQAVEMPTEHLSVPPHAHTPSHSLRSARAPSHLTIQSMSHPSMRQSQHGSLHPSRASIPLTVHNPGPDDTTEGSVTAQDHHPSEPGGTPWPSQTPQPVAPPGIGSPVYVPPQPAPDYDRMASPVHPPSERSIPSQLSRVGKFFRDLNNLPWVSSNVAVDFVPDDSARSRYLRSREPGSWYSARHRTVDLLAGGPSMQALTGPSGHSLAQGPIPGSSATLPSHAGHRHGSESQSSGSDGTHHHHPSSQGHGPYIYPTMPIYPAPPVYLYPTAYPPGGPSPRVSPEHGAVPNGSQPDMQTSYPFYMLAMPPAPYMQMSDPSRQGLPLFHTAYPAPSPA